MNVMLRVFMKMRGSLEVETIESVPAFKYIMTFLLVACSVLNNSFTAQARLL
jgi:hypothetical protein